MYLIGGTELMLLGFVSLLLAVTQESISKICIPSKLANTMLPCRRVFITAGTESLAVYRNSINGALSAGSVSPHSRKLADDDDNGGGAANNVNATDSCSSKVYMFFKNEF